ncbi:FAD-dependent oxidoreductase [Aquabacterium fontiphilum]|jgi:NADH dehydrogenase|uniref:NAD(P)/FAD-dependent oxidoreductase n=1 Tax=Aquabacterium fontiphilum TaxID=450365 RepID=UPI0013764B88|nr:NAD(P)/FAD-dependent oxidoreductase [Aquabacterium fontiphilum]NBD22033.1 FAD-dependent oxidoreductase [Aquabacterium fontiphilum]
MSHASTKPVATPATPRLSAPSARPRVVIIGCGFGGLEAAKALDGANVEVIVIDRTNHHLFQPLLYQVATAGLSAPAIAAPIRHVLRTQIARGDLTVLMGEVNAIDTSTSCVVLDGGEHVHYDHLIVAAGATHSYFGRDEWAKYAPGLKTLGDAFTIRRRVLSAFEQAERETDPDKREPWLTFAIVGAGPTGVEMAGTLAEISRETLKSEFRRIDSRVARIILLEGAPRVLGAFPEDLSERAREQLEMLGAEVLLGAKVTNITAFGIHYELQETQPDGSSKMVAHFLPSRTVVWAAGVAASPLGRALAKTTGCELDRAGRVVVQPDLTIPGHPNIYVVGDLASAKSYLDPAHPTPVPGVSPGAKQMGRKAAFNILRRMKGLDGQAFRYFDYGSLATIGKRAAVASVDVPFFKRNIKFSGFLAWLFWLFVHVYFLIGFRNRTVVLMDWAWAYFTSQRHARVFPDPHALEPTAMLVRVKEPGSPPAP